ncbi:uncharacterized protein LOC124286330 [Haliotis rubra]|uniref:uncharacterized protein LOC124286330 n=1 Tax=Haliotis rubra TaxID=36100 RepID=UPI001EE62E34|nr:uncharacterized protein LOC124286330 [Haliotis rubra]
MIKIALCMLMTLSQTTDGGYLLPAAKDADVPVGPVQFMMAQDTRYSSLAMSSAGAMLWTSSTDSLTDCARLCVREVTCVALFYNTLTGVCVALNVEYGKTKSKTVKEADNVYYTKITKTPFTTASVASSLPTIAAPSVAKKAKG